MSEKLTLKVERGRLVLELPQAILDLEVNGKLQAEYCLGKSLGPEDLRAELSRARCALSACRMLLDVVNRATATETSRLDARTRADWADGLRAGLMGQYAESGNAFVPPSLGSGPPGLRGWELGFAIRRALELSQGETPTGG